MSPHDTSGSENARIALYVRLTSVLRNRVLKGAEGDRFPNIVELCDEYGAGRNTIRQALDLLIREGLLTSTRGRGTFINKLPSRVSADQGLAEAISDPLEMGPQQKIKILLKDSVAKLPDELSLGAAAQSDNLVRVRKLHYFKRAPFALMDIFVAKDVFDAFPPKGEGEQKIARLLHEAGFKVATYRQQITVVHPTYEMADLLRYSMTGSLVRIMRWRTDSAGRLLTAGTYFYRSDLFVLDIVESNPGNQRPKTGFVPSVKPRSSAKRA